MTDLQIMLAVGGALGVIFGGSGALLLVWLFRPQRLYAALHIHLHPYSTATARAGLVAAPRRTPAVRPTHPVGARPHRPAHTSPTGILGDLAATHPELAERLRVRYREAMATPGAH